MRNVQTFAASVILMCGLPTMFSTRVHAVDGVCVAKQDQNGNMHPCSWNPGGGPGGSSSVPSGPSPAELKRQREEKDLHEAADDADDRGVEAYERGEWDKAVQYFREANDYRPGDEDILHNLHRAQEKM